MASWEQQTSPLVKYETSPAESFLSAPGDSYPSLFEAATPADSTMNPLEIMTPRSYADERDSDEALDTVGELQSSLSSPTSEKKPVKKRKSWGQVLPEPKTNLPPRKRAKTDDEKEQRRVERVLRNRRAAQSSRERKRLEVEALEIRNQELENALINVQKQNLLLVEELNKFRRSSGVVTRSSNPVTLSQELFSSQDGRPAPVDQPNPALMSLAPTAGNTVNPASLSPELSPVPEVDSPEEASHMVADAMDLASSAMSSVDGTTAVLAGLDVHGLSGASLLDAARDAAGHFLNHPFGLSAATDADCAILESELLASPNSLDLEHDYLAGDSTFLSTIDAFDFTDYIHEEDNGIASDATAANGPAYAADPESGHGLPDFETQVSSENINLQPQSGASAYGCDDGGIAVGV